MDLMDQGWSEGTMDGPFRPSFQSMGSKNKIGFKKIMQVKVDKVWMCTKFSGCGLSSFEDFAPLIFLQISLLNSGLHSPWGSKNRIGSKYSCK